MNLGDANVIGTIPKSLNALTDLQLLWINDNQIISAAAIGGGLSKLEDFDVSWNNQSGPIPQSWFQLTKLTSLDIYANHFSGSVPADVGALTKLTKLTLANNVLAGTVPTSVKYLTQLKTLNIEANQFTSSECTAAKMLLASAVPGCALKC